MLEPSEKLGHLLPDKKSSRFHVNIVVAEAIIMSLIVIYLLDIRYTSYLPQYDGRSYGIFAGVISAIIGVHHFVLGVIQSFRSNLGGVRIYIGIVIIYFMWVFSLVFFEDFFKTIALENGDLVATSLTLPLVSLAWFMVVIQQKRWAYKNKWLFSERDDILDA